MKKQKNENQSDVFETNHDETFTQMNQDANDDIFASDSEYQSINIRFHNLETEGEIEGIFLGMGPQVETKSSEGGFNTYALLEKETQEVVLIPAYTALEKINDECTPGEFLIKVKYLGMKEAKGGRKYKNFSIQYKMLNKRFTDFDIDKIQAFKFGQKIG